MFFLTSSMALLPQCCWCTTVLWGLYASVWLANVNKQRRVGFLLWRACCDAVTKALCGSENTAKGNQFGSLYFFCFLIFKVLKCLKSFSFRWFLFFFVYYDYQCFPLRPPTALTSLLEFDRKIWWTIGCNCHLWLSLVPRFRWEWKPGKMNHSLMLSQ